MENNVYIMKKKMTKQNAYKQVTVIIRCILISIQVQFKCVVSVSTVDFFNCFLQYFVSWQLDQLETGVFGVTELFGWFLMLPLGATW